MAITRYAQFMVVDTQSNLPSTAQAGDVAFCLDVALSFTYDGTNWMPGSRALTKRSSVTVNGKSTGSTLIYTLEASNFNFYPALIIPRAVNVSGVVTPPSISIGSNASSYNNIATASLLSTLLSALGAGSGAPRMADTSPPLAGSTAIYANVGIAAVATTYSVKFDILGYYGS